jgi:hypothetical protein
MEEQAMLHQRLAVIALALLMAAASTAAELPTRKAGLWEIKTTSDDGSAPPQVMQQCIDAATDKQMNQQFGASAGVICSKNDIKKSGSTIVADATCNFAGATTTTHAVYTGDFNSAYTAKVTTTIEGGAAKTMPGLAGPKNSTMEAKWLGVCKPGQKPGDIVTAEGMKLNIFDLSKSVSPPPR